MPKKKIPPEIKAQIIQTIKDNPQITIPELKERFNFDDGRVLVGLKKLATGRIVPRLRKEEEIKQNKHEVVTEPITEIEKKN